MIHLWPGTQAGAGFLPFTESVFPFVADLYNARKRFEIVVGCCIGLGWVGFGPVGLGCALCCLDGGLGRVLWVCVGLAWLVGRLVGVSCGWLRLGHVCLVWLFSWGVPDWHGLAW